MAPTSVVARCGAVFTSIEIPIAEPTRLAERARRAEELGFDAVNVPDHPAPTVEWMKYGHPTLDPFVVLGAIATATTTLRLHTNLLVLPYRNPLIAAKAITSLDAVSSGRVILGVGVGYLEAEFDAVGADFDGRGAAMEHALITMRQAWTGEPMGDDQVVVEPMPVQLPHPPIWVGGNSKAAMRRSIQHGQGWSPMPSPKGASARLGTPGLESIAELAERIDLLHQMAADAERTEPLDIVAIPTTMSGFARRPPTDEELLDEVGQLAEAGATALVLAVPDEGWDERIEQLAPLVASGAT